MMRAGDSRGRTFFCVYGRVRSGSSEYFERASFYSSNTISFSTGNGYRTVEKYRTATTFDCTLRRTADIILHSLEYCINSRIVSREFNPNPTISGHVTGASKYSSHSVNVTLECPLRTAQKMMCGKTICVCPVLAALGRVVAILSNLIAHIVGTYSLREILYSPYFDS